MRHLRLTHPDLPFWIDVRGRDFGGRWLVVADLADEPEVGIGTTVEEAMERAFGAFAWPIRRHLRLQAVETLRCTGEA